MLQFLAVYLCPLIAVGQTSPGGANFADISRWRLERVTCRDGESYAGLLRYEDEQQIELVEVRQPAGKEMYLLVRPIPIAEVATIERLEPADRAVLRQRIDAFRRRVAIQAALVKNVRLIKEQVGESVSWHYDGPWFSLDSRANEQVTREAIVRIEQTFAAYRTMLAPRRKAPRPLRIVLAGSPQHFREQLAAAGLKITSAAFFDPRQNLIVTAADLARFAQRLEEARAHHAALRKQMMEDDASAQQRAQEWARTLKSQGADPEKRVQAVQALMLQYEKQRDSLKLQIRIAEQQNDEMYYRQFTRLYHEALHAYLDNYVFDPQDYDVPRWLNEGWAQIFEAGRLEVGTLRIDAPRPDLLAALAADLRSKDPPRLADILTTPAADYVAGHQDQDATAKVARLYRTSWGLAWYLTFERQLMGTAEMEAFLRRDNAATRPVERFEKLVGQKLPQFEAQWRQRMLELAK